MLDKQILTNLKAGWCDFNLGNFKGRVSYVRDVPTDIINGYIEYVKTGHCVIEFDEEKSYFSLVVCNDQEVYIIAHRNTLEYYKIDLNAADIVIELFNEVENNLDDWINWSDYFPDEKDMYKCELKNKISDIWKGKNNE